MNARDNFIENIFSFHGGVHPEQNKAQTSKKGIINAGIPEELVIPLLQHIGAPAKPIVNVGDKVLKGQIIAQANGFVSVPLHAPTSGSIIAIEERPVQHPSGLAGNCIIIKSDGLDTWCELNPNPDFLSLSKDELASCIRDSGIVGMGGAGFPSAIKLNVKDKQIQKLIVNSVECEPYITSDDVLIQEYANEILIGLEILNQIIQAKEIIIGIEDNKPETIEAYKRAIDASSISILKLAIVPTKYPSGGEKQLIQLVTGKEVPAGGLPSDLGIVCQNTGTIFAIYEAVVLGQPLISRITTLAGKALTKEQNYRTLIGTPFKFLLEESGINWQKLSQLIMGGPMMGFSVITPDVPVVKTTNCILASAKGELTDPALEQPCIRCGSCAEVCPANLLPQQLYWYSKAKELEKTDEYNLADCIECGACSFVCPSNIPLVQYFRFAKGETRKKNIELEKSEQSRERFEARKARIEREAVEKEAKRLAKAEQRKLKKAQHENKSVPSNNQASPSEKLEIALQIAKTNAAKSTKQWKEAQKSLEAAEKLEQDISEHEKQVKQLELTAQKAQVDFKAALAAQKIHKQTQSENETKPQENKAFKVLQEKIDDIRDQSSEASETLKNIKKSLLSEKSGSGDTSDLEQQVANAKQVSDTLKGTLRDLIKEQKTLTAASSDNSESTKQSFNENKKDLIKAKANTATNQQALDFSNESSIQSKSIENENKKNQLKIQMAQIKVQAKKLKTQLDDSDDETRTELEVLISNNQEKLNEVIEEMAALNNPTKSQQDPGS
jgi:electron transport complex protein RnfC